MIRIVITSSHALVRIAIRRELSSAINIIIADEAETISETIEKCRTHCPDILLIDLKDRILASEVAKELEGFCPHVRIIILTADEYMFPELDLKKEGIDGCLLQEEVFTDILQAVYVVADGGTWMSNRLLDAPPTSHTDSSQMEESLLTDREVEVAQWLSKGLSNAQIANVLCVSVRTARFHVENLMKKLNANNRTNVVVTATRMGLVDLYH